MTEFKSVTYRSLENLAQVETARQHVFLADIQDFLAKNHQIYSARVEVTVYKERYGVSRYVHFWDEEGTCITADTNFKKGHYVHPANGSGSPEAVAHNLANSLKWYRAKKAANS